MHTEESRALVKQAWTAFSTRDPERIAALFTEDADWLAPPGNATAIALNGPSHMIGAATIAAFIAIDMRSLFVAMAATFRGFYADGPIVVVEAHLASPLADGRAYANDYCFIFECRDGRIAHVREYMDTLNGRRQIFGDGPPAEAL